MKLPALFSRTSTGAVQSWEIEVQENRYRTISGQTDGKKVVTEWTVCESKNVGRANATSPEQQAEAEAQAKWQKKVDSGYRESVSEIDHQAFVEPMLAKAFEDYESEIKYPVACQPKYDGIRCIVTKDTMSSRTGKPLLSAPHIRLALKEFFETHPSVILDGELYCDKFANDFNKICSLVKKSKPTAQDLRESAAAIQYWVYDIVDTKMKFSVRTRFIQENLPETESICKVPTNIVYDKPQLDLKYTEYIIKGYEGQMVRIEAEYECKRSRNLLKRKEFKDEEFQILDVLEGDGNKSGMAAAMTLIDASNQTFNSNIKGDRNYLRALLKDRQSIIGKQATVKYFNLTPDGIPRFPYVIAIRDYE